MHDPHDPTESRSSAGEASPFLAGALEAAEDGLLAYGLDGEVRYFNGRLLEVLAAPDRLFEGRGAYEAADELRDVFLDPDRFDEIVERERRRPSTESRHELRLRDGRVVHRFSRPIRVDGEIVGRVCNVRDVTELRQNERCLEQARRIAGIGSWSWDAESGETVWSDELYRLFGVEKDAFEPSFEAFLERVHPEDRDGVRRAVERSLRTGEEYRAELRVVLPDGEIRHVQEFGEIERDGNGGATRLVGVKQDVTALREERRERRKAERRYRTLFEMSPLALVVSRPGGEMIDVNRRFERLLGREREAVIGREAHELDVWTDLQDRAEVLDRLARGDAVRDYAAALRTDSGEVVEAEISVDRLEIGEDRLLVWAIRDVTERNEYRRELERKALYDDLTGLPNRTLLHDRLQHAMETAEREGHALSVLFVDLDDFRAVNDAYGHGAGDRVLSESARRMAEVLRESDTLARLGGDEFVAVLHGTDEAGAERAAGRVVETLESEPFELAGDEIALAAHAGIATRAEGQRDAGELIRAADAARTRAKREGGAGQPHVRAYRPEDEARVYRLQRRSRIREALERDEFVLHYQPVVDIRDGNRIVGAEALVRWRHPERGLVPPGDFIPFAEETGLIRELDHWVLRAAVREALRWTNGLGPGNGDGPASRPYLAVNVSAPSYQSPEFSGRVGDVLAEAGLSPSVLQLEITERLSVSGSGAWSDLRSQGVRLAVDDFGSGYSSLRYLKQLEADILKLDRYFTQDLANEGDRTSIILQAVLSVGQQMGMELVAEGVETEDQREHLRALGYRYAQGFHFARPMPADELEERLAARGG